MSTNQSATRKGGLSISRVFSANNTPIEYEERDIRVKDWQTGEVIFAQDGFAVPKTWSENAGNIVASKYAFGPEGEREAGVDVIVNRVAGSITHYGWTHGYFATLNDSLNFYEELSALCMNQYGSFNSPVWFNVGIYKTRNLTGSGEVWHWNEALNQPSLTTESYRYPQTSACFIQSVEDSMESIMDLARSEAMLFKHGSGSGTDFSKLRSKRETLSTGGKPSGPLSFMKVYDRIASVVKSGGKTRRAAKMQTLSGSHPDIMDFIRAKGKEERKAHLLIKGGMDNSFNSEAYDTVAFQNANFTVRLSDEFMYMYVEDGEVELIAVTTGDVIETVKASSIFNAIAEETWVCGDPGVQFLDTINEWHTCPYDVTGTISMPINSSNPCSEYLFQDDSACNLASLRLTKFVENGVFNVDKFKHAVRIFIIAQDILVDHGSYPTKKIAQNQHDFRTLGLGFADLGGMLIRMGIAYDSVEGRDMAGAIASILSGEAYIVSSEMAVALDPFAGFAKNRTPMLRVIKQHESFTMFRTASLAYGSPSGRLWLEAVDIWSKARAMGVCSGYRNAQVSVIAPTGTIAFMMDCDTTGIEPSIGLIAYKTLAGGGHMVLVNPAVKEGLESLGYSSETVHSISQYVSEHGMVVGCMDINPDNLDVFDCALAPKGCDRFINYSGHLGMMAAVQPFISGAISKTVNVPEDFTVEQIAETYYEAWELGLKCVAIYRDKSKSSQPVTLDKPDELNVADDESRSCSKCKSPILMVAGTCTVCPSCGTTQGGCS